jgi:hypothetical protein
MVGYTDSTPAVYTNPTRRILLQGRIYIGATRD